MILPTSSLEFKYQRVLILFTAILCLMSGFLVVKYEGAVGDFIVPGVLAGTIGVLLLFDVVRRTIAKGFDIFEVINVIFLSFFIGYVLRSFYIVAGNYERMLQFDVISGRYYLTLALLLVILGILAFIVGYSNSLGENIAKRLPHFKDTINYRRLYLVYIVYSLIGIGCFILILQQSGGIRLALDDIARKRWGNTEYLTVGTYLFFYAGVLRVTASLKSRLPIILQIHIILSFVIPITTSSRINLFFMCITLLIIYNYGKQRISLRTIIILGMVLLFLYYLMLGLRFNATRDIDLKEYISLDSALENTVAHFDFSDIVITAHFIRAVPDLFPLQYGKSFLVFITRPIPRIWWPDKPEPLGPFIGKVFLNYPEWRKSGIPPTFIGELYWNFHFPGVVIGMLLAGIMCRTAYEYLRNNQENLYAVTLYAYTVPALFQLTALDANTGLTRLAYILVALIFPYYFISRGQT